MPITDENEIKLLVKSTIAAADLERAVTLGDNKILTITGIPNENWDVTDPVYLQLRLIGSLFGAWNILSGWDEKMYGEKADRMRKAYEFEMEQFRKMPLKESNVNPNIQVVESVYTHYKLNPAAKPFMSDY